MLRTSGFLCVHKPPGVTSRDVVNVVQRLVRPTKVGHAGTLDPLATGVLVVALGSATRLVRFVQDSPKEYRGTFELGLTTDTEDLTGNVLTRADASSVTRNQLASVVDGFVGAQLQLPPQYSALHVQGQRAYDLARQGIAVELAPRPVQFFELELLDFTSPRFTLRVTCSGGTYIRSLGRDIGARVGCGAAMSALVRTAVGPFLLEQAVDADALSRDRLNEQLWPITTAVEHLPRVIVNAGSALAVRSGRSIAVSSDDATEIAVLDEAGDLIAVGEVLDARLQPRVVLPTREG